MSNAIEKAQPSALMQLLNDADRLKDLDADKLEKLMSVHLQFEAAQDKREFAEAFNRVQSEMVAVPKRGFNAHTKSHYALAEDLASMLDPLILKHGFSWSISTTDCPTLNFTRFVLTIRRGGHVEQHHMDAPIDSVGIKGNPTKTLLHGQASSYTYCERHLRLKVFGTQTAADDDGNAAAIGPASEKISQEEALDVEASLESVGGNKAKLLAMYGIERISDLPKFQLKAVHQMLAEKGRR